MWVWIEHKSDGISFVFALFLSLFPSRLLFFLMSYLFFSDWKQILRIWFYSHALVSMNNEVCRFCEKMTREKHKDWLLLRNQLIFCLVIFHSLSLSLCFFPDDFLILNLFGWLSATKSGHFLTAFDLILLSTFLFVQTTK